MKSIPLYVGIHSRLTVVRGANSRIEKNLHCCHADRSNADVGSELYPGFPACITAGGVRVIPSLCCSGIAFHVIFKIVRTLLRISASAGLSPGYTYTGLYSWTRSDWWDIYLAHLNLKNSILYRYKPGSALPRFQVR